MARITAKTLTTLNDNVARLGALHAERAKAQADRQRLIERHVTPTDTRVAELDAEISAAQTRVADIVRKHRDGLDVPLALAAGGIRIIKRPARLQLVTNQAEAVEAVRDAGYEELIVTSERIDLVAAKKSDVAERLPSVLRLVEGEDVAIHPHGLDKPVRVNLAA